MSKPLINKNGTWIRHIHDSWVNSSGYRTDIPESVYNNNEVKKVAFILDDMKAIVSPIEDLREALRDAPRRPEKKSIGPYNVNPHNKTINGKPVRMEIKDLNEN